ncbi:MAG: acyl-CoA dehydrogenase [Nitrospirota bacterium]
MDLFGIRRRVISASILRAYRKAMPSMSQTEREALEAGTVWWDAELFSGKPNWARLLSEAEPKLTAEERAFLDGPVHELCGMLDDWRITEEWRDLPPEVWRFIREQRFFGMIIPKRYGGLEFSALAHSCVVMKLASRSITGAVTVMVPNSLGPAELLLHYGTEEQKNFYLPRLARGEEVPCFALTGPESGSDAASMPDTGVICRGTYKGQSNVLGVRLNWNKRYITLAPVASVLGLAFKCSDPDHLIGEKSDLGITVALIPTNTPGITIGRRHVPIDIPFQNGPTQGKDVFVPMDAIIGGQARIGQGWRMLMECLAAGRAISLPALATGACKLASRSTGAYARVRKQFKTPIGRFEGVEEALARIAGSTYATDAARVMTLGAVDRGEKPSVISAMIKYHLTELMRRAVNDAMDVHGGSGIVLGPRNFMARVYQAVPISITVEGANIMTRSLIIFGQGAIRCHPYVLKELRAASDADQARGLREFDRAFFGHLAHIAKNAWRAWFHGLTGARFASAPTNGPTRRYFQRVSRMSACLALASDVAMIVVGAALKRKESLSARLGDVLSHLYLASASLKRFEDQGRPEADLPLVRWACEESLWTIEDRLDAVIKNFPNRVAAGILRMTIFPWGRRAKRPNDRLAHQAASVLLEPSAARDRLTEGVYAPQSPSEAVRRLDLALEKVVAADAVEKTLRAATQAGTLRSADETTLARDAVARGVITQQEADTLSEASALRREVIQVDDFASDYGVQGQLGPARKTANS